MWEYDYIRYDNVGVRLYRKTSVGKQLWEYDYIKYDHVGVRLYRKTSVGVRLCGKTNMWGVRGCAFSDSVSYILRLINLMQYFVKYWDFYTV